MNFHNEKKNYTDITMNGIMSHVKKANKIHVLFELLYHNC